MSAVLPVRNSTARSGGRVREHAQLGIVTDWARENFARATAAANCPRDKGGSKELRLTGLVPTFMGMTHKSAGRKHEELFSDLRRLGHGLSEDEPDAIRLSKARSSKSTSLCRCSRASSARTLPDANSAQRHTCINSCKVRINHRRCEYVAKKVNEATRGALFCHSEPVSRRS